MPVQSANIQAIYRYPVKGLSAQALAQTRLSVGATLPADRLYAIENGPSGFDPSTPAYFPKQRFLMWMRNERLATLQSSFDEATHTLSICTNGAEAVRGNLRTAEGRVAIESFFAEFCANDLRGPPKVLSAPGHSFADMSPDHSFSDVAQKVVSIINLATVAEVENAAGAPVHPLRFRGNVYVAGWPAWREFDLIGREIAIGPQARLKIVRRIRRCAATDVDPDTGIRDLTIPQTLMRAFGHTDCGVYARVVGMGEIAVGDALNETQANLPLPIGTSPGTAGESL
ncbi:MAG: uncharacterized protein QOJ96_1033 [Alphaproteobacteria bacterium]|nr:uncharacterized protein [Alphaproteobacteria bacterium]